MKQNETKDNKYSEIKEGDYRMYICHEVVTIQHLDYPKVLKIEKVKMNVEECDLKILSGLNVLSVIRPHAILGVIALDHHFYLIYVTTAEIVGTIQDAEIYKLLEVDYIPLFNDEEQVPSFEIINYLCNIKNLLTMGFYYSFKYDLTTSLQKQVRNKLAKKDEFEKKFYWNYNINRKLFEAKVNQIFTVKFIFGYVNISEATISGEKIMLAIISRRSNKHAGTRYNTRGITDEGNVANFVETEQILKIKKSLYSVILLRGSAPIFFEQSPLNFQVSISRNPSMSSPAFLKHLEGIQKEFKYVLMMNLMSESKKDEELISNNFKNQFLINNINNCKYHQFDIHDVCKKDSFEKLEDYIDEKLGTIIENFNFFCYNEEKQITTSEQKGVFRINCLDCLDRTNIFESRIAWQVLLYQVIYNN